jgi:manganese-dependent inorganic pyrophosphatase
MDMFKAGTSLKGLTKNEIVNTDLKVFHTEEYSFAVGQILTLDYEDILNEKEAYVNIINEIQDARELSFVILSITDIIKNGSYILYTENAKKYIEAAFNIDNLEQGYYMDTVVSRKKQIVPYLMDILK